MTNRRKFLLLTVTAVIVAGAAGWVASSRISSPADLAARTAPPDPSAILVPAEELVLTSDIVTRGTARFGSPEQVFLAPSSLKLEGGIAARLPLAGAELGEGDVVMTSSGRPIFLLEGENPSFRDLGPGLSGDDVKQLEEALVRFGFNPGPPDGVYDDATGAAVAEWYNRTGFTAFEASDAQLEAIRALRADSTGARIELISAKDAAAAALAALEGARAANARAIQSAPDAQAAVVTATEIADANNRVAEAEVATKQATLDSLLAPSELPATPQEIAAAEAELALAKASAEATRVAGLQDVAAADAAERDAAADKTGAASDLRAAEAAVLNANAALAVRTQQAGLADSELGRATARAGVQVPADEVIFLAKSPVRVAEVAVTAGGAVSGELMAVTSSVVAVDGALRLKEAPLARVGMSVRIDEPDLNISETGVISRVAESPGTNGVDGFHVWFEVLVDGSPASLVGTSVRLILAVESTGGTVLAVPVSAVSLAADGSSRVQLQRNGVLEFVVVNPGLSAEGYVEVTASSGDLKAGDLVVIGFDQSADLGFSAPAEASPIDTAPAETAPADGAAP